MPARIAGKYVCARGIPRKDDVIDTGVHVCIGRRRFRRLRLRGPSDESSRRLHLYAGDREHHRRSDHLLHLFARVRVDRTPSRRPKPAYVQYGSTAGEEDIDRGLRHCSFRCFSDMAVARPLRNSLLKTVFPMTVIVLCVVAMAVCYMLMAITLLKKARDASRRTGIARESNLHEPGSPKVPVSVNLNPMPSTNVGAASGTEASAAPPRINETTANKSRYTKVFSFCS